MQFTPEHKSKPPLRWIANIIFHPISVYFLMKGLAMSDKYGDTMTPRQYKRLNRRYRLYKWFDKPYSRWGTLYKYTLTAEEETAMILGMVDRKDI